jgi:hypothetical protein
LLAMQEVFLWWVHRSLFDNGTNIYRFGCPSIGEQTTTVLAILYKKKTKFWSVCKAHGGKNDIKINKQIVWKCRTVQTFWDDSNKAKFDSRIN